ncbi:hypothetical protein REPUB_Repub16aG0132200 [Reevesia pubescens]
MDSHHISKCGLGLVSNETPTRVINPNVIESSSLKSMTSAPSSPPLSSKKKDPGGIGFIDDMGGGVDGLMSCTESLGFESCNERRVDDDDDDDDNNNDVNDHHHHQHLIEFCEGERDRWRKKKSEEKRLGRDEKKFPPPLSSLNQNGQPCFYLKPVRKNGRLELTEVKIQRPEVLRAVRENGRLRLHLISSDVISSKINEEEEEEETKQEEEEEVKLQEEEEEEEEEEVEELWKYKVSGEGFRRCHELVMSHHHRHHINDHHSLHVWRQPCVTR